MEMTTSTVKRMSQFKMGVYDGLSIALGYMPVALAFGLLAKSTGLSFIEAALMSILVYAGAAQYVALNLIALGTGGFAIILTTFLINIRHLLLTASLTEKVEKASRRTKALYAFWVTDETFSVAATKEGIVATSYMFGLGIIAYMSWVSSTAIGYAVGASLPEELQQSMGFALYAMFIGLLVPSFKKQRKIIVLACIAAILNSIFTFLLPPQFGGWAIVAATLISALGVELFTEKEGKTDE